MQTIRFPDLKDCLKIQPMVFQCGYERSIWFCFTLVGVGPTKRTPSQNESTLNDLFTNDSFKTPALKL